MGTPGVRLECGSGPRSTCIDVAAQEVVLVTDTTPETHEPGLENLLTEDRRFPPSPEFVAQANAQHGLYAWANADRPSFWAEQARELLSWEKPFEEVLDWSKRAVRALVRRRHAQRGVQRGGPARRGGQRRPGRPALRGRGRRHPHGHLRRPAARGVQGRERVHGAGRRHGRPRRHLPAADPRGRRHDAGVRAHRRPALGRVRRLLRGGAEHPDQRRRGQARRHRGRRLPPRARPAR